MIFPLALMRVAELHLVQLALAVVAAAAAFPFALQQIVEAVHQKCNNRCQRQPPQPPLNQPTRIAAVQNNI